MTGAGHARRRRDKITRPPALAIALAGVATAFFAMPFVGLLWRVPWGSVWSVLSDGDVGRALRLSIQCSLAATALSTLFGVPLAWVLATVVVGVWMMRRGEEKVVAKRLREVLEKRS